MPQESVQIVVGVVGALAVVLAAVLGAPRLTRDARSSIARDLEIYHALPETSPARAELLTLIERRVQQLSGLDAAKRSPASIGLGIAFLVIALALGWPIVGWGGWWWIASPIVLFVLALGLTGVIQGAKKVPRDEKGNIAK